MNDMIEICFRLINMVVLLSLCFYVVKRFVIPLLYSRKHDDQQRLQEREGRLAELDNKHDLLQAQLNEDMATWEVLKQKIVYWNGALDQKKRIQMKLKEQYAEQLQIRKIEIHKQRVAFKRDYEVGSLALIKATERLTDFFVDQKMGEHYIAMIVKHTLES